jgi:hypothetical protein
MQLDVYANPLVRARRTFPYVVVLQANPFGIELSLPSIGCFWVSERRSRDLWKRPLSLSMVPLAKVDRVTQAGVFSLGNVALPGSTSRRLED